MRNDSTPSTPPLTRLRPGGRAGVRVMGRSGFTLIELILVMSVLLIVLAVAAPSLGRFFKSRSLDSEARRFLALTRYGQSRAVSEGIPVVLWMEPDRGMYGLEADPSYLETDNRAVEFQLDKALELETEAAVVRAGRAAAAGATERRLGNRPTIRFTPEGFIGDSSPTWVLIREGEREGQAGGDQVWLGQDRSRLRYEIQTNEFNVLGR